MNVSVLIPTWMGEFWMMDLLKAVQSQTLFQKANVEILIADSSSFDRTQEICRSQGIEPLVLDQSSFDHGGTRTWLAQKAQGEFLIFLTQDAIPEDPEAFEELLKPFEDSAVSAVCGRQLPHHNAGPFGAHLRQFNYPAESSVRSFAEREKYGVKTVFLSDSFAAYRKSALADVGFFPEGVLFGEDSIVCAKFILGGAKVAYQATAKVRHSHDYTLKQDFHRYFDIGVFHVTQSWAFAQFPKAEGEGKKFVLSEFRYLLRGGHLGALLQSPIRIFAKYAGYLLGKKFRSLPRNWVPKMSMCPHWWQKHPEVFE